MVVLASCKAQGFLRVSENDIVTLMEATNPEMGFVYVRLDDGTIGKIPRSAIRIDLHTSNLYLESIRDAVKAPKLLWNAIAQKVVTPHEVYEMLVVSGLMYEGLCCLFQEEISEHPLDTEFMRGSSPATMLAGAIFQGDTACKWLASAITQIFKEITYKDVDWTHVSLLNAVQVSIIVLLQRAPDVPGEVALLLKALQSVSSVRMAGSYFCLRFLCPALALHAKSTVTLAKALQLVANAVDPPESSFMFQIQSDLQSLQQPMEQIVRMASSVSTLFYQSVPHSLKQPASRLYLFLRNNGVTLQNLTDETVKRAEQMLERYGE